MQDPQPDFQPRPGLAEEIAPGLRRVLAPNPSPMTFRGTNTYLLGTRGIAVIDPGPDEPAHLQAILNPNDLLTIGDLARRTGAPVLGFGPAEAGRSAVTQKLAAEGLVGGGEGVDTRFEPDVTLADGDTVAGDGWTVEALHTPGHMANHLSFAWGDVLFSGDLVMGWATSLVSPPDGDLTAFMASLERLQERQWSLFHAGHGAPVTAPADRLETLLSHRRGRETAILESLAQAPATARSLAERIYTEVPPALLPAATRNVLAHLIDLTSKSRVSPVGELSAEAVFRAI